MSDNTESVARLEAEVERLMQQLDAARKALDAAKIANYPFKVGEVVEAQFVRGGPWEPVLIRDIEPETWGPWYIVSRYKIEGRRHSEHSTGRLHKKTLHQIRALQRDGVAE